MVDRTSKVGESGHDDEAAEKYWQVRTVAEYVKLALWVVLQIVWDFIRQR
jgi:hypothetical protein